MHTAAAVLAKATPLPTTPRRWIQWMPPGEHEIECAVNGQPKRITARSTPAGAAALQRDLDAAHAAGRRVHLDFNHEANVSAGQVLAFRWSDAQGIEAEIDWSTAGAAAISGKTHPYLSPEWSIHTQTGECLGLRPGRPAGGLVMLPAFRDIQSVAARLAAVPPNDFSAAAEPNQNTNEMKHELIAAAALASGLITKEQAASDDAGNTLTAAIAKLKADAASGAQAKAAEATHTAALAAAVQAKEAAETELKTLLADTAKKVVAAAQARKAIPPQDKDQESYWMTQCTQPGAAGATARQVLEGITGTLPKPTGAGATARDMGAEGPEEEEAKHAAAVKARAMSICEKEGVSWSAAFARAADELAAEK